MELPPRVLYPRRFHASPSKYTAAAAPDLRDKLATLVDRNEKVKKAYHQLQSQIASGLAEVTIASLDRFDSFVDLIETASRI